MASTYDIVKKFNQRYTNNVCWRVRKHCKIIDDNLNPNEEVLFAFAAQNNAAHNLWFDTAVLALTNDRIIIGRDELVLGYRVSTITPDLYNDMQVHTGLIWGTLTIDTVKEEVVFSNIDKKALSEIQKTISSFMIEAKKRFYSKQQ